MTTLWHIFARKYHNEHLFLRWWINVKRVQVTNIGRAGDDNETNINYNRCVSPVVLVRENLQRPIIDGKKLELKRSKNLRYIIMVDRIRNLNRF